MRRILASTSHGRPAGAFTLLEVLLVIAMIAILLSILLPTLGAAMESGRAFRCQMSLRSISLDFNAFADDELRGSRGDDDLSNSRTFRLETFQESQYGIDEFWAWESEKTHVVPDEAGNNPMRCDSVRGALTLSSNTPCSKGALSPPANVSFTFNSRLDRAEVQIPGGPFVPKAVLLTSAILEHGMVPLAWDVDGQAAKGNGVSPVFSAPALDSASIYSADKYWFPSTRHNGASNFAFIDGHVEASTKPLDESGWLWGFQPID